MAIRNFSQIQTESRTDYGDQGIDELDIQVEFITPEIAERMIEGMAANRKVSQHHTESMARAMRSGQWKEDAGDPIRLNSEGLMIDGQHRMWAIIESGRSFNFVVIRGVENHTQMILDTGRQRTLRDQLNIIGEVNSTALASSIGFYDGWLTDGMVLENARRSTHATIPESIALLEKHPELRDAVSQAEAIRRIVKGGTGRWAAIFLALNAIDETDTEAFFDQIKTGENLSAGSPVKALRKRLFDDAMTNRKLLARDYSALVFKTWNAYREGRKMTILGWRPGGASPEKYPTPV